ncbi:MAG: rhodanese-like domain-containing protein [Pseudomonadota bacterium]|nr:rhodanese-like domain-containing protein [Pseudomonadota bacterium]
MPIVTTSVKQLVDTAKARIEEIPATDALALAERDDVVIVDIRDVRERQKLGFIPQSVHAPRGMLEFWVDPDSPYHKPVFAEDKKFILHCASGWRSALAAASLLDMGFEVAHITEGFSGWIEAGGAVEMAEPR